MIEKDGIETARTEPTDECGADIAAFVPPPQINEYQLIRPIGRGGMGLVYLGQDTLLKRPVAVKFLAAASPTEQARKRFLIEARAIARLQHPNVVAVYRVGIINGLPYLVSEYLTGRSLDMLPKPVSWQDALRIGLDLARGLAAVHRQGVLHRDIKPAKNISVGRNFNSVRRTSPLARTLLSLFHRSSNPLKHRCWVPIARQDGFRFRYSRPFRSLRLSARVTMSLDDYRRLRVGR